MPDKIKITRKELEELYDIEEDTPPIGVQDGDEVTVTEHQESWEEATERKDKENKWLSE